MYIVIGQEIEKLIKKNIILDKGAPFIISSIIQGDQLNMAVFYWYLV